MPSPGNRLSNGTSTFQRTAPRTPTTNPYRARLTPRPPGSAPSTRVVNPLACSPAPDDSTPPPMDDTHAGLVQELDSLAPCCPSPDRPLYHTLQACVHRIQAQPELATGRSCICCGRDHTFDMCPVLKDVTFLQSFYKRWCQHWRREQQARAQALPASPTIPSAAPRAPVNAIENPSLIESPMSPSTPVEQLAPEPEVVQDPSDFPPGLF